MSNKYESVKTESFEVDGFVGEVKKTYAPNRIDPDGRAFGTHMKCCEVSLTDSHGNVWCAELGAFGRGGYWCTSSTEFKWQELERVDDTLILKGEAVVTSSTYNTYNERLAWNGGRSTSCHKQPIEIVLRYPASTQTLV